MVPPCITSTCGLVPLENRTPHSLTYKKGQVIARALKCYLDDTEEVECRRNNANKLVPFTLQDVDQTVEPHLEDTARKQLLKLLNEYRDCFAQSLAELGMSKHGKLHIQLKDETPITYRPYRLSHHEREIVRKHISELKEHGIVQDSMSPWASPILLVKKKNGELRMCVDNRKLNKQTVPDKLSLIHI